MPLLEGTGITKRFGGLVALQDVDFHVEEGEIVGLLGPNGAGKTTLFNVIAGTFPPTAGSVSFDGRTITGLKPYKICRLGLARTFQIPKPFPSMSVRQNIAACATFGCDKHRKDFKQTWEIDQIMEQFGLKEKQSALASNLAVFELRMLEIARGLVTQPKLLLLDEVMAGLNPKETAQISLIIREIRKEDTTILMIEHNMRATMGVSDRVIVLDQGMKIADGEPEAVCNTPCVVEAYLGEVYVAD
jgi:branched-chain amino acid transport system ATP-binding protein